MLSLLNGSVFLYLSAFLSYSLCLWIGAQFPQDGFPSYDRTLTFHLSSHLVHRPEHSLVIWKRSFHDNVAFFVFLFLPFPILSF